MFYNTKLKKLYKDSHTCILISVCCLVLMTSEEWDTYKLMTPIALHM